MPADPPGARGAAIEVRLYAEDPAADWRPNGGTVRRFAVPGVRAVFDRPDRPGIRLDAGVVDGTVVGTAYDPMLAKVIAWAPTRAEAAARLAAALAGAQVHGLTTNRDLLVRALRHPDFLAGRTDTGFFDRIGLDVLAAPLAGPHEVELAALAGALAVEAAGRRGARVLGELPSGWRNVPSQLQRTAFEYAGRRSRSATGTRGMGCWSRAGTTSSSSRRITSEWSSRCPASSTGWLSPSTRTPWTSTVTAGPSRCACCPASRTPRRRSRRAR
ncbi:hypothetical protein [Blastococcus brunescens]|uniref:Biotin carboxylation domain-containing protein n=1 Tax=Blastococcus brunescens TaxID=1564165 RepID=A0ABZ1B2W3_9ACTN|nr:hypothetical protein [Blastococcus sp. BMG 8361]WRL63385.1 hypothetical protein U6N30_27165 [Blastococcus sp. BMG 8361]